MAPATSIHHSVSLKEATVVPLSPQIWHVLSLMRFVLALIVAASHLRSGEAVGGALNVMVRALGSLGGHAAVISFLLISGFSIAHSLRQQPQGFIRRRFWRIYPVYLIGLLFTLLASVGLTDHRELTLELSENGLTWAAHLFMLQGVTCEAVASNVPLWTLSLEWWFYMLSPLLIRLNGRGMLWLLGVLTAGFLSWILVGGHFGFYSHVLGGLNLLFMGVFWVLGFAFYFYRGHPLGGLALVLAVWFLTGLNRESLGGNSQLTLVIGCAGLVIGQWICWPKKLLPVIRLVGEVSFPLYIFHLPFFHLANQHFKVFSAPLLLAGAVGLALLAHLLIEVPLRRIRGKS